MILKFVVQFYLLANRSTINISVNKDKMIENDPFGGEDTKGALQAVVATTHEKLFKRRPQSRDTVYWRTHDTSMNMT